jgi:hypothetical protein
MLFAHSAINNKRAIVRLINAPGAADTKALVKKIFNDAFFGFLCNGNELCCSSTASLSFCRPRREEKCCARTNPTKCYGEKLTVILRTVMAKKG